MLTLVMAAACLAASPALGSEKDTEQQRLMHLLVQDCGSCHGLRMTGGLGPALTPDALAPIPRSTLTTTILYGRPGTAMPPWRDILTEDQAEWIVERLLKGLPPQ